jgi:hypothetical protein
MERRNLEQCCAIKFCVKRNKNATEIYEKLKRAYGDHAVSRTQVFSSIKHFCMVVRVWKANLVLEDLARQKRTEMWPKWGISWGLTDVWQSEWSVVCWIRIVKPSTKFWPSNWACRKFADTWMLHHDNAPCHTAISVNEFLAKKIFQWCRSYHTRLIESVWFFFLFLKLKFHLKDRHLGTVDNIQKDVTDQLRALSLADFQHCYRDWEQRLRRCMASEGNYSEGDKVDL